MIGCKAPDLTVPPSLLAVTQQSVSN